MESVAAPSQRHAHRGPGVRLPVADGEGWAREDDPAPDRAAGRIELPAQSVAEPRAPGQKHSFVCSACGYGIVRGEVPEHCPMCRREDTWIHAPWRPFTAPRELGV